MCADDTYSIKQVEFKKSLGVYLAENLTWNVHIKHISKKIASCIGILKRSRSFVPFQTHLCIFNALFQAHSITVVSYGVIAINLFPLSHKNYGIVSCVF